MWRRLFLLAVLLGAARGSFAAPKQSPLPAPAEDWLARARDAEARGLVKRATEFAGRAIDAAPSDPRAHYLRAQLYQRTRQFAPAEADLGRAIELSPDEAALFLQRGLVRLCLSEFTGSVADFDKFARLQPSRAADLWQRGIALFYAKRFDDGRRQFELHRTVNPRDVENSAWHFACIARTEGLEAARARWMPVQGDGRVPMKEIQDLMTQKGSPEAVLAAAEALKDDHRRAEARFYGHLYLALFYGADGRRDLEARHAAEASKAAAEFGIMGEIARVHADWVAAGLAGGR